MELLVGKGLQKWVEVAHSWCEKACSLAQATSIYLPAGNTPIPLYKYWEDTQPSFLSSLQLLQLDEILTGEKKNYFSLFFREHLPSWQKKIISPMDSQLDFCQAQVAVLGLGKNGHLGFHEPGLSLSLYLACVPLASTTCENLQLKKEETWGVTYGLQAFLRCHSVLILVRGEEKKEIVQFLLRGDHVSPAAELLRLHPRVTLLCDDRVGVEKMK